MIILCKVYKIDVEYLGFDLVGEIVVVMVVVLIVFKLLNFCYFVMFLIYVCQVMEDFYFLNNDVKLEGISFLLEIFWRLWMLEFFELGNIFV